MSAKVQRWSERKRKEAGQEAQRAAEKRQVQKEIANLQVKKAKLEYESAVECRKIDCEIAKLEKQCTNK